MHVEVSNASMFFEVAIIISAILLLGSGIYWFGIFLELEYPYWRVLRQARYATTDEGETIFVYAARQLHCQPGEVHLHRCSYCQAQDRNLPKGTIYLQARKKRRGGLVKMAYRPLDQRVTPL